jgi:alpha/beta superfamily hydrolase
VATEGQLLERAVVIPVGDVCLDGIYLRGGGPGLLIASALPGAGGSMAGPVAGELAYAAAFAGAASLRVDYRGVGGSEGEPATEVAPLVDDLREGVSFLCESTRSEGVVVAGLYSGAWAALALAREDPRVELVLLVCPRGSEAPDGAPAYGDVSVPVSVVLPGADPDLDLGAETGLVDAAMNARMYLIPNVGRHFREGLRALADLVPPLLGRNPRDG